ncbi:T-cell surface glycoprotein CD8 beta chain [Suncus etruscus]|uniref:T-cell surface glycoprotein CD8 beta chain n=1 Tax=Suncus etruscus TaxID=109475 RepID=UPI00210F2558|nr:T-cell surface glycoprotein CD8 beta chain [Suncus etruscus]
MQPRWWIILAAQFTALLGDLVLQRSPRYIQVQTNRTATMTCDFKNSWLVSRSSRVFWLKQCLTCNTESPLEFLASLDTQKVPKYGNVVEQNRITLFSVRSRFMLNITNLMSSDSGVYFCMIINTPQLIFGTGTQLSVVDVLPTAAPTTKKSTPKKKVCQRQSLEAPTGLSCGFIPLSLLVVGVLVLLLCLGVVIHCHRKSQLSQSSCSSTTDDS